MIALHLFSLWLLSIVSGAVPFETLDRKALDAQPELSELQPRQVAGSYGDSGTIRRTFSLHFLKAYEVIPKNTSVWWKFQYDVVPGATPYERSLKGNELDLTEAKKFNPLGVTVLSVNATSMDAAVVGGFAWKSSLVECSYAWKERFANGSATITDAADKNFVIAYVGKMIPSDVYVFGLYATS